MNLWCYFRDIFVSAPLKLKKKVSLFVCVYDFRDIFVSAPLKHSGIDGSSGIGANFRDIFVSAPLKLYRLTK